MRKISLVAENFVNALVKVEIGERGVATERVAYDNNLASDILCRALALR